MGTAARVVRVALEHDALPGGVRGHVIRACRGDDSDALGVERRLERDGAEGGQREPVREIGHGRRETKRQPIPLRYDSADVSRPARFVGAGADEVAQVAPPGALHDRVEGALDRVLERLRRDRLAGREAESLPDRERVGLSVRRACGQRLGHLRYQLGAGRGRLVREVDEAGAGGGEKLG